MCASGPAPGLIDSLARVRGELVEASSSLSAAQRDVAFAGTWDARDLLAHLIGWDYTNLYAVQDFRRGRLPNFYARYDPQWAAYNAELVARHRQEDWDALLASLRRSQAAVFDALRGLPDDDLTSDFGVRWQGRRVTIAGLLRAALRDEREHLAQIRQMAASQW
jgi:hypothetical protein